MAALIEQTKLICAICTVQFSKYTCPKCNIQYCSLNCYKSKEHGQCSELFYRDCVMEELSQQKGSLEERKKMLEILERFTEEQNAEEEEVGEEVGEEVSLEERLKGIDLDSTDQVWDQLTENERCQFNKMYQNGTLSELITVTAPWWTTVPKIIELDQHPPITIPTIVTRIPKLSSLIKVENISPCIAYNLINILYSYVYTIRLYNGCTNELPVEISKTLIELSSVLSSDVSFSTVHDSIGHCIGVVSMKYNDHVSYMRGSLVNDVAVLIETSYEGNGLVVYVLSDIFNTVNNARRLLKGSDDSELLKRLFAIKKKIEFYISWSSEMCHELKRLLHSIYCESKVDD